MFDPINNPFTTDPVLKDPIHRDRLIGLINETLGQRYPRQARRQSKDDRGRHSQRTHNLRKAQVRYNAFRSTIARFEQFLSATGSEMVTVDEKLMLDFGRHLSDAGVTDHGHYRGEICRLINSLPSDVRQRKMASMVDYNRAHRWDGYSKETPRLLDDFLRDGRKMKPRSGRVSPELSMTLLSKRFREQIVSETMTFLRAVQATDLLAITADDVEEFIESYEAAGKRQAALGVLSYIRPLFTNLLARGKIASDPLADVPRSEYGENLDYVPQEGMDKLADLSTVEMADFKDVRDRLLCFSIYYDFALRNREGSLLKVSDLRLVGHTSLVLPKEIQKVQREDSLLFSYFPEVTRPLLDRYLELRARKNPSTDNLFVSDEGVPLLADGCRGAVKAHCDRLGVKTLDGRTPTPHRLRHTFGTLNIAPLGRCLDIIEVKEHYRHTSIDTTYRLYIAKNNIMKTQRFEARMRANGNSNGGVNTNGNGWVGVPAFNPQPVPMAEPVVGPDVYITEDEAIRRTRGLGLNYRTLRVHGVEAGKVRKNGKGYEYLSRFIADLSGNYLTTQEAMDLLKMPRSTFFVWRRSAGVDCIQIGNVGLYSRDVILRKKRGG